MTILHFFVISTGGIQDKWFGRICHLRGWVFSKIDHLVYFAKWYFLGGGVVFLDFYHLKNFDKWSILGGGWVFSMIDHLVFCAKWSKFLFKFTIFTLF